MSKGFSIQVVVRQGRIPGSDLQLNVFFHANLAGQGGMGVGKAARKKKNKMMTAYVDNALGYFNLLAKIC